MGENSHSKPNHGGDSGLYTPARTVPPLRHLLDIAFETYLIREPNAICCELNTESGIRTHNNEGLNLAPLPIGLPRQNKREHPPENRDQRLEIEPR